MVLCLITIRVVGVTAFTVMSATQTLLVDMMPNQGSSITACVRPAFVYYPMDFIDSRIC
jgi:hypothetical protein